MTRTAIIAAFPGELKPLVRQWPLEQRNNVDLWRWPFLNTHGDKGEWVAACAGAGTEAATRAFAEVEKDGPIDQVISTGWAGALHRVIEPGLVYSICGVIDARTGEMTPAADWRDDVWLVTSPIVANELEKHRLASTYNAGLVDMEAAAIARLAMMRNIPFFCIKGVSDGLNDNLPDFNRFLGPTGQLQLARFTLFALFRPRYWPSLIQMGENSRKAAEGIAAAVLDILDKGGTIRNRNGYPDRKPNRKY
jgi:adenosylhomocysteine nucleosidase